MNKNVHQPLSRGGGGTKGSGLGMMMVQGLEGPVRVK